MLALHQSDNGRMASQSTQLPIAPDDDGIVNAELTMGAQGFSSSAPLLFMSSSTLLEGDSFHSLQQQHSGTATATPVQQQQQQQQPQLQPQPHQHQQLSHQDQELFIQAHLQHIQQPPQQQHQQQHTIAYSSSLHPLQSPEKAHSPTSSASTISWTFDFPPLPRGNTSSSAQGPGLLTRSLSQLHPLQQTPPHTLSRSQAQSYVQQQQQQHQQSQQFLSSVHGPLSTSSFSMNFPSTPSSAGQPSVGMLGQQDTPAIIPEMLPWGDQNIGASKTDIFQLTSPPTTPSGIVARSPNSYNGTPLIYGQHHKRPPLWPMDRPLLLPLPRQTLTPQQSSKAANLQYVPCKFFKSGACTAGKNCLFSHSRDIHSENHVCKYFLKGNCKFGSKCSLSHSFLSADRKSSAMNLNSANNGASSGTNHINISNGNSNGNQPGRARLERRASSSAIANSFWPSEPLSPPFGPPVGHQAKSIHQQPILQAQQHSVQLDRSASQEFFISRSPSQPALYSRNMLTRSTTENFRHPSYGFTLKHVAVAAHDLASSSPSLDDTASSSPESNSLASTFGSSSIDPSMASINGSSFGIFESRTVPRQHLAAPLPIRQRSLPDIFCLGPCSGSFASTTSSGEFGGLRASSVNGTGPLPPSPFYPTGGKTLFLGVPYDHDVAQSSPTKLHSIPERFRQQQQQLTNGQLAQNQQQQQQYSLERRFSSYNDSFGPNSAFLSTGEAMLGDFGSDEEGDLKTDLGYLPSSLSELLNSGEHQPQQDLEGSAVGVQSNNVLPSPASTLREEKDDELGCHDRNISTATTLATSRDPLEAFRARFQSPLDDLHRDARHDSNIHCGASEDDRDFSLLHNDDMSLFSHAVYDATAAATTSSGGGPMSTPSSASFHPLSSQFNGLLYDEYGHLDPPQVAHQNHHQHHHQDHQSHLLQDLSATSSDAYNNNVPKDIITFPLEMTNTVNRSGAPDPFCSFSPEADEVQFVMDDDLSLVANNGSCPSDIMATTTTTTTTTTKPLGFGLFGEPTASSTPSPPLPLSSPTTLAPYASALQLSSTSRYLGDAEKRKEYEGVAVDDSAADIKQDANNNLVALMNSLDISKACTNSI